MSTHQITSQNTTESFRSELACILAKGVLRHIRIAQATTLNADNQASKNDLLFFSGHGSLSRELTDKEVAGATACSRDECDTQAKS